MKRKQCADEQIADELRTPVAGTSGGYRAEHPAPERDIVFFDGVCNLCNYFVDFVLRRDSGGKFAFAPMQGETAQTYGARLPADPGSADTVTLLDGDGAHIHSEAVLRVMLGLGGMWGVLAMLGRKVPRPVRDSIYSWVARNRFAWFGQRGNCRVPLPEERERLLP
jgi:predicted DCC family thiol-disulfide oxidoreductase YuxK